MAPVSSVKPDRWRFTRQARQCCSSLWRCCGRIFDWLFRTGEQALKDAVGKARERLARDAYSIAHFPIVAGVILFAVGAEELLAHPDVALDAGSRWAFVGGLMLFIGSQSMMARRFTGSLTWDRFVLIGLPRHRRPGA